MSALTALEGTFSESSLETPQLLYHFPTEYLDIYSFKETPWTAPGKPVRKFRLIEVSTSSTAPDEKKGISWDELSEDSTVLREHSIEIDKEAECLFEVAKEQVFEDGMESNFSRELISLVEKYGNTAIGVITRLVVTEQANAEVASEALRWLGRMEHSLTYQSRMFLLERSLYSRSARIRDGAALGLASLDNPHAIPHLRRAIHREKNRLLRNCLEQVLFQLENTN